jgi:hypothetical protein
MICNGSADWPQRRANMAGGWKSQVGINLFVYRDYVRLDHREVICAVSDWKGELQVLRKLCIQRNHLKFRVTKGLI